MGAGFGDAAWRLVAAMAKEKDSLTRANYDRLPAVNMLPESSQSNGRGHAYCPPHPNLNLWVGQDPKAVSQRAAEIVLEELRRRPELLMCASAGASPSGLYAALGQVASREPELFERMRVLKVDEWGGLPLDNPATCEVDLINKLLVPLRVSAERYEGFRSDAPDPRRECERVAQWLLREGPIDLCVLGLGANGHLAMNEPDESLCPYPHVARLSASSMQHPMLAASTTKPAYGLTLGMGELMRSKKILLPILGRQKREVLKRLLQPSVSTHFPASFLWLHPDVAVLCDRDAAGDLPALHKWNATGSSMGTA
jgi:galactosamine-6-phosphate isomerase